MRPVLKGLVRGEQPEAKKVTIWVVYLALHPAMIAFPTCSMEPTITPTSAPGCGGMAVRNPRGIQRSIHNIENSYFRTKFEPELANFRGNDGIGVISDTDPQPLLVTSHLGTFGIVTVGKVNNLDELVRKAFDRRRSFFDTTGGVVNPTEMVAKLICEEEDFEDGIRKAQAAIRGSCTLLLLTDKGIYAARDRLGRTPLVIGRRQGAVAVSSESCAFPNLGLETEHFLGPGEVVFMTADGWEQRAATGLADADLCLSLGLLRLSRLRV